MSALGTLHIFFKIKQAHNGKHLSSNLSANYFAVKYRKAVIDKKWNEKLFGVIGNLINETKCKTIIVNGVEDHVHCFIGLKPVVSISELMKTVKAKSSKYINDHSLTTSHFEWSRLWREIRRFFL